MPTIHNEKLPLSGHVRELRRRIVISFLALLVCTVALFPLAPQIFSILAVPMYRALPSGVRFIALDPFEAWSVYMKIAVAGGIILSSPVWIGQIYAFISPAFDRKKMRAALIVGVFSGILFASGAAFCYAAILPAALEWGVRLIENMGVEFLPRLSRYISLVLMMLLTFGLAFELPFAIAILMRLGIVTPRGVARGRPYVIVGAFIAAAILTPPDIFTQVALAVPLILLFELGALTGRIIVRT